MSKLTSVPREVHEHLDKDERGRFVSAMGEAWTNQKRNRASLRARSRRNWLLMQEAKADGCLECGSYSKLRFHHRDPETKSFGVASNWRSVSTGRLRAEIAKCDVLCHQHHVCEHRRMRAEAAHA